MYQEEFCIFYSQISYSDKFLKTSRKGLRIYNKYLRNYKINVFKFYHVDFCDGVVWSVFHLNFMGSSPVLNYEIINFIIIH